MSGIAVDLDARISAEVDRTREEVIETRRVLHRHPELSLEEHDTADLAAQRSADLGFTVRTGVGGTGVLADLDSGRPGPTLMLRADMDALPIAERGEGRVVTSGGRRGDARLRARRPRGDDAWSRERARRAA